MDRFIGKQVQDRQKPQANLKSNMDRFIVDTISDIITDVADLKSNMDRFIGSCGGFI